MKIYQHFSVYGFSNTYILGDEKTSKALIIDPAEINAKMIDQIESNGYGLSAILITHNHTHHIRGLKTLLKIYAAEIYASNARILDFPCTKVKDQDILRKDGFEITVLAVPGHSQDSIVYRIGNFLFTGDVIHAGLIGKTTSSFNTRALADRIKQKLMDFPDDMLIFPGHGPPSTIGTERRFNVGLQPDYVEKVHPMYDFFV
jgi:glyoxylase-like metal-dependent hydrolase (beta-lactamase superfamily II)